ncbi:von Willebrand factor A domain-containing protein 7 [Chionoecetes opilio]|uniref:von Willebrand factor A domain-containing protein 7 n=1 Tax=Chionoecetes opilio TaxID=41210 RepID=A0A8J4XYZ4_CHIOP|nr:von Willebrand factor A domain-containing protein 7 [Chionoecetes opilio]
MLVFVPWAVLGCLAALPSCSAFLPTSLNFSDPNLSSLFCPDEMDGPTTDHKAITREALRREVRRFFLEVEPANSTLTIPEDASLSQIYRAVYGISASPARFMQAVNDIAWSNAMTEAGSHAKFQAAYHMDGERVSEGHALLQGRYQQLIRTITVDKTYDFSRELLGESLNGIQDFYSQTTWLELGRNWVLEGLGLPGADIGEVAGPSDKTCTNCDSPTGACTGNVIPTSRLSSGYYEYTAVGADEYIVAKPVGVGKCSHGGPLDSSISQEAKGGINKETSSPCFSPHHHLHQQAVNLAISASEHYIGVLRDAIGNDHFVSLLNLFQGSALSIVIDTTGSMGGELITVKEEARLIVENSHPEMYVFVPYGDPGYGPVTKTSDEEEFLKVLDAVEASGGCCCVQEKFWHGLQLSLINAPDYTTIFCFTDAGANDAELMEGVLALVTAKHCKVNIIYSYSNSAGSSCPGYDISGTDELEYLAMISGGLFIELDKFDAGDIDGIMQEGVDENKASLVKRDNVNSQSFSFPVDDAVIDFDVTLFGAMTEGTITDTMGTKYDLMDKAGLAATDGVEVISHTDKIKAIKFTKPIVGDWIFEAEGAGFNVAVSASSTLSLLSEFAELDLSPPRPGYVVVRGQPLSKTKYYVEVTLIGYLESHVRSVTYMKFLDTAGNVLSNIPYDGILDEHFFILSDDLPVGAFYIQVEGYLESGNPFIRIYSTMAQSVECLVELMMADSVLSAIPGETTQATFRVHNYGPKAEFRYTAIDEEEFISSWSPVKSTISSMGFVDIPVDFVVPSTTSPGTTSTITFTANSLLTETNVNTYITYYLVLDKDVDSEPPTCTSSSVPDCTGFDTDDTCSGKSWVVQATLQDSDSGLLQVYTQPDDGLTLDGFTTATTDPVKATFTSSCCLRAMTMVGVDVRGNLGYCQWDLGPLKGTVLEFEAESVGETWVNLRWNISEIRDDLDRYSLYIDEDYTDMSRCPNLVCYKNETYLDSCTLHTFKLTPHYEDIDGVETQGSDLYTDATTLGPAPKAPTNPTTDYVGDTTTSLSWTPPSNRACLDHYNVCFKMFGSQKIWCDTSSNSSIVMKGLQPCTVYHVNITSVSLSDELSEESLLFDTNTDDAAPGAPQHLKVDNQTEYWVSLAWDNPLERASCVDRWMVTYIENDARHQKVKVVADNHATVSDLDPCTSYTFFVSAVSPRGAQGGTKTTKATLDEIEPTPLSSVVATALDATSVMVEWIPALKEECVHHYLVCIIDLTGLAQECHNITDLYHTFTSLEACVDYEVTVTPVAPSGKLGTFSYDVARTVDLPTSPPTSLEVKDITAHSALITYGPPFRNPLCVIEYDIEVEETGYHKSIRMAPVSTYLQQMLYGLHACSGHEVRVSAVTGSGHTSDKVVGIFTTSEDTPSIPRALTYITTAVDQVELHWFSPLTNPLCIDTYKVSWSSSSGNGTMDYTPSGHPPEVKMTVSGLASCSPYTFTVVAVTPLGDEGPGASYTVSTSC